VVCGSHTRGATAQIEAVIQRSGSVVVVDTARAMEDGATEGKAAATTAREHLDADGLAVVMSERVRSASHNTLAHGQQVMSALITAVHALVPSVEVIVAKGGITSADVARIGIGARSARVLGQVLAGVSVWQLDAFDGRAVLFVVVPGNVGDPHTITQVLDAVGR
jgi:hypothetical protein